MRWLHGGDVSNQSFYSLTCEQEATLEALGERTWRDMNELRSFEVDGADVGMAAISSAVSYIREPELDSVVFKKLFSKNIITAALVYYSIKNILAEKMPDSLLLFSGRFSSLRPALRAAQKLGIKSYVHERAGSDLVLQKIRIHMIWMRLNWKLKPYIIIHNCQNMKKRDCQMNGI